MSCGNMAGMESLYIQLSEEIASKSNKEWKVQTGATYRILWQNVFYQMICPKAPEQSSQQEMEIACTVQFPWPWQVQSQLLLFVYI